MPGLIRRSNARASTTGPVLSESATFTVPVGVGEIPAPASPQQQQQAEDSIDFANDPTVSLMQQALHTSAQSQYSQAIVLFEQLVAQLESTALRRNMLWRAGICHICRHDMPAAASAIEEYAQQHSSMFAGTTEFQFLQDVLDAVALNDVPRFVHACSEFDRNARLDSWAISLLLRIKTRMHASQDLNAADLIN